MEDDHRNFYFVWDEPAVTITMPRLPAEDLVEYWGCCPFDYNSKLSGQQPLAGVDSTAETFLSFSG